MHHDQASEEKIITLVQSLRKQGKHVPVALSDIPGFPFRDFGQLRTMITSGQVLLRRFSFHYDSALFSALARPGERFQRDVLIGVMFLVPVLAVILAFLYAWWSAFGLLAFFVGMKGNKKLYNSVIFRAALYSEPLFCFLYYARQVSLGSGGQEYYWKGAPSGEREVGGP